MHGETVKFDDFWLSMNMTTSISPFLLTTPWLSNKA